MIKLVPAFKDYLWGGVKLKTEYGKQSDLEIVAESWELSTHPDGLSTIANGEYEGQTLLKYIEEHGKGVLGTACKVEKDLPILIKLIDAKDRLSIQVHPDDQYALLHEGDYGKTEMWYVVEAEEGAQLIYGFNKTTTQEELRQAIRDNSLADILNYVEVHKGDVFFIKPGTVHAIGEGVVIAEIQQRSNVTYRVYDYGRVGVDGKPRELHIDQSIEVMNLNKADEARVEYTLRPTNGYQEAEIAGCEYFHVNMIEVDNQADIEVEQSSFKSLLLVEGKAQVISGQKVMDMTKGETVFLPAGSGRYELKGTGKFIVSGF